MRESVKGQNRPQELVLDLLGLHVLGRAQPAEGLAGPVPTRAFLDVLGPLGISEAATRATLNRMASRGLLLRRRQGRTSAFEPSKDAMAMLRQGRARLFSPAPFDHAEDVWTILDCPIPESLRNLRYQMHAHLAWSGFGRIQANLWAAPGRIDVQEILDFLPAEVLDHVQAFHGSPTGPTSPTRLVRSAWDLEALRAAHLDFAARWETAAPPSAESLPQFLLLIGDWGRLLRADPGLPAAHLGQDWPADQSTHIFQRFESRLGPQAEQQLKRLVLPTDESPF